jgi:hypothetical protein
MRLTYLSVLSWLILFWAAILSVEAQSESTPASNLAADSSLAPPPHAGRGTYSLVVYAGIGWSYYLNSVGIPTGMQSTQINRSGLPATLRVMWHPDHKLRLGLESGWLPMYTYTSHNATSEGRVSLSAVPLLIVWSMPVGRHLNLFAGTGYYMINSQLEYEGTTNTKTNSLGWMAAASYIYPINKQVGLAAEVKWMNAVETADGIMTLQLQLVWTPLRW